MSCYPKTVFYPMQIGTPTKVATNQLSEVLIRLMARVHRTINVSWTFYLQYLLA
jgi:hypothetical protein